jgi:hypothetical protein
VLFHAGRWCVTAWGITCLGKSAPIEGDRLNEDDWLDHLLGKNWLYDPTDFLDAFEAARTHFHPDETPAMRAAAVQVQIMKAMESGESPYYPSSVLWKHAYRVSHMNPEQRAAFAHYLAEKGYVANH